jgi:hypothetical protein|tara:strand:+ start:744 stop:992 length:249 start_codon:yes stop_codon:yes gene_type:complete
MKVKNLAENGLTGSSIGDAMSAQAQEGWLEYDLMATMNNYMKSNNFVSGYAFAKHVEGLALELWRTEQKAIAERNADKELPF